MLLAPPRLQLSARSFRAVACVWAGAAALAGRVCCCRRCWCVGCCWRWKWDRTCSCLACAGVQRSARPCARETDVCRWRRKLPPQNDCALQRRLLVPPDPEVATETYLRGLCASDTSSSDSALMVVARRWRGHTSNSNADQPQGCLDTRSSVRQRNPELLQSRQMQRRPRGLDKGASDNVALRLRCFKSSRSIQNGSSAAIIPPKQAHWPFWQGATLSASSWADCGSDSSTRKLRNHCRSDLVQVQSTLPTSRRSSSTSVHVKHNV